MLVYKINLKNPITNLLDSSLIYVDSKTKKAAEQRIIRTFDNLISYEFVRTDNTIPSYGLFEEFHSKTSYSKLISDYVKNMDVVYTEEIKEKLNIKNHFNYSRLMKTLGFKYNQNNHRYERFKNL